MSSNQVRQTPQSSPVTSSTVGTFRCMNVNVDSNLWASVALALATGALVFYTFRLWNEARLARAPRIVAMLDYIGPNYGELRLVNAGAGAAIAVDVSIQARDGELRKWTDSVVLPGDGANFNLLSSQDEEAHKEVRHLDDFVERFAYIEVRGSYTDVAGKSYELEETVDVRMQWNEAKRAGRLAAYRGPARPFYELTRDIRDELRRINQIAEDELPSGSG